MPFHELGETSFLETNDVEFLEKNIKRRGKKRKSLY
jgi:hypothetical protein